ncbi:ADP-ribosyl cyclase/cyclic ADP-ribose hydrolase 1-like [Morone saxatilis]|uniref:ADP-ribosyl cyclase/cyclic ADP-ribose hydrolase 1-like n=1 Tax=Morone saxatilis TaxID=34816 RepID=UPI0015E21F02|nr:ADP-ribosyl cyclase/cyclic ADP-ribose hydrolase 1-like [Morone saxatilis]
MEQGEPGPRKKSWRRRYIVLGVLGALVLIVVIAVVVALVLRNDTLQFKGIFIDRCKKFNGYDCKKVWEAFEQAYVGRDPCDVPMEAYDPFVAATPFEPACNRMMFWSKTKDVVHEFTAKSDCFVTLEDTVLGAVADGLIWCGKEGSSETFTTDCPGWRDCVNNPVRSFWNRVSAAFADAACGNVTAMLNGSIETPFSSQSIFGSIELLRFNSTRMESLNIVMVTQKNPVANCTNESLNILQRKLDKGIQYYCNDVSEAQLEECSNNSQTTCGACW